MEAQTEQAERNKKKSSFFASSSSSSQCKSVFFLLCGEEAQKNAENKTRNRGKLSHAIASHV
jgi:hypothetical protein